MAVHPKSRAGQVALCSNSMAIWQNLNTIVRVRVQSGKQNHNMLWTKIYIIGIRTYMDVEEAMGKKVHKGELRMKRTLEACYVQLMQGLRERGICRSSWKSLAVTCVNLQLIV